MQPLVSFVKRGIILSRSLLPCTRSVMTIIIIDTHESLAALRQFSSDCSGNWMGALENRLSPKARGNAGIPCRRSTRALAVACRRSLLHQSQERVRASTYIITAIKTI